ncbi:MAG: hypothetical protein II685_02165, partial [Clostridia bacterium]|nr:hypothetical protein [Clostridia bacterium]
MVNLLDFEYNNVPLSTVQIVSEKRCSDCVTQIREYVQSAYSIEKFTDIFRASKLSETVELGIGNDQPITITFKLVT